MSDKPTSRVSMSKSGAEPAAKRDRPSPPRFVVLAAGALVLSGLAAVGAALSLYGQRPWLTQQEVKAEHKAKKVLSPGKLYDTVSQQQTGALVSSIVLALALGFAAYAAYRGRYWTRWVVLGLWVLSTFTGTLAGIGFVLGIATDAPLAFKLPAFLAGVLLIAAVVLTNMRPSVAYFSLSRPERPAGASARRGMFAPRNPAREGRAGSPLRPAGRPATRASTPARAGSAADLQADRSRAKQRAHADAVAKGAELARTRAKASKSRRSGL